MKSHAGLRRLRPPTERKKEREVEVSVHRKRLRPFSPPKSGETERRGGISANQEKRGANQCNIHRKNSNTRKQLNSFPE